MALIAVGGMGDHESLAAWVWAHLFCRGTCLSLRSVGNIGPIKVKGPLTSTSPFWTLRSTRLDKLVLSIGRIVLIAHCYIVKQSLCGARRGHWVTLVIGGHPPFRFCLFGTLRLTHLDWLAPPIGRIVLIAHGYIVEQFLCGAHRGRWAIMFLGGRPRFRLCHFGLCNRLVWIGWHHPLVALS